MPCKSASPASDAGDPCCAFALACSARMTSLQMPTHSSQMSTPGPAISCATSSWLLAQNEQCSVLRSTCEAMRLIPDFIVMTRGLRTSAQLDSQACLDGICQECLDVATSCSFDVALQESWGHVAP